jgi:hypothetical protein
MWFLMGPTPSTCPLTGVRLRSTDTRTDASLAAAAAAAREAAGDSDDWWAPAVAAMPAPRPASAGDGRRKRPWSACLKSAWPYIGHHDGGGGTTRRPA